jgi:hypothetical protein
VSSTIVAVRLHAMGRFVAALEASCPALVGKISTEADRDEKMTWPKMGIRVVRAPFKMNDRRRITRAGGMSVYDVGHFEPLVQLRLGAPTHAQRADLGEQLLGAFLGTGFRPGILITPLPACHDTVAAWELDEEGWTDEAAFDKKWYATMTITGFLPALVKAPTYTIEQLRLVVAADLREVGAPPDYVETVSVLEDGTMERVEP